MHASTVPSMYLLFSTHSTIRRISLDTNDFTDVSIMEDAKQRIHSVLHYKNKIYWSDAASSGLLYSSDVNGSNVGVFSGRGSGDVSVDTSSGNIYYINNSNNDIEVTNGRHYKVVVSDGMDQKSSITVDPLRRCVIIIVIINFIFIAAIRKLYWIDNCNNTRCIKQANVNGSGVSTLFSNNSYYPIKLRINNGHLYWIDADTIQKLSLLDAYQHPVTVLDHASIDIVVHNNFLFTVNATTGEISQTDINNGRTIVLYTNKGAGPAIHLHTVNTTDQHGRPF